MTRKTHPVKPQNVTGVINGDGSITVNWNKVEGALSYLTHYGDANQGVTSGLKYIGYSETNSWTLAAENVPKLEVGDFITVTIQAYHVAAPSDLTEKEKAEFLDKGPLSGSEWSDPVMLTKLKTHIAYAYSADGTDRFTTIYPNLNLFTGTSDQPITKTGGNWNNNVIGIYNTPEVGKQYTTSIEIPNADHDVIFEIFRWNNAGDRVGEAIDNKVVKSGEKTSITFTWEDPGDSGATQIAADLVWTNGTDTGSYSYCKAKLETGSIATPYMPSSSEVTTADWPKYVGTYTDSSESQSENPSDYNWKLA